MNNRYIRNKTVSAALEQAYDSYIPDGKFPCCVLKIDVHPAFVDANVHPTKAEVKFSDDRQIFEGVYSTVRLALEKNLARPEIISGTGIPSNDEEMALNTKKQQGMNIINSFVPIEEREEKSRPEKITFTDEMKKQPEFTGLDLFADLQLPIENKDDDEPVVSVPKIDNSDIASFAMPPVFGVEMPEEREQSFAEDKPVTAENYGGREESPGGRFVYESGNSFTSVEQSETPFYRIIGEAFYSYIFVEMADKVLIIDKHAAHERMIFEELKSNMKKKKNVLQFLLVPAAVELDSNERATAVEYCDEISAIGFEFRAEESGEIMLYAIPVGLDVDAATDLFMTVCTRLGQGMGSAQLSRDIVFEKALYQASCKAAIKAGRPDAKEDTEAFIKKLLSLPDIRYCPHGRPVAFEMTKDGIEKQFKRK